MLFKKSHLNEVLETTSESMDVFVPAIVDGTSRFALYGEQGEVTEPNFQLQNTKIPPKGLLFPSTEKLYTWGKGPDGTFIDSALETPRPFVAFGVRPCDAAAIERMDQVFLSKGYIDEFYQAKRNALTLVAMACPRTSDACFCDSMGRIQTPLLKLIFCFSKATMPLRFTSRPNAAKLLQMPGSHSLKKERLIVSPLNALPKSAWKA